MNELSTVWGPPYTGGLGKLSLLPSLSVALVKIIVYSNLERDPLTEVHGLRSDLKPVSSDFIPIFPFPT